MSGLREDIISGLSRKFSVMDVITQKKTNLSASRADLIGAMSNFQKRLKEVKQDYLSIVKYLDKLENMLYNQVNNFKRISAALDTTSKKDSIKNAPSKILDILEDRLGALQRSSEILQDAKDLLLQIKSKFGSNKAANKLIQEANNLVNACKSQQVRAINLLKKIALEQCPDEITPQNNSIIKSLYIMVKKELAVARTNPIPELGVKKTEHMMDILPNGNIRFSAFTPMINVPTIDGNTINVYLMVAIDMLDIKNIKDGTIEFTNKFTDPMITIVEDIVRPQAAPKLYKVKNGKDFKKVLEFLAQRFNLTVFGEVVSGNAETRREKLISKLDFFNDKNITITSNGPFITAKIPRSKLKFTISGKIEPRIEQKIYKEMALIAGLPTKGNAQRYNIDRLRIEKIQEKGKFVLITFRVMQVRPDIDLVEDNASNKGNSNILDKEAQSINSIDNSKFMEELKKSIGDWL